MTCSLSVSGLPTNTPYILKENISLMARARYRVCVLLLILLLDCPPNVRGILGGLELFNTKIYLNADTFYYFCRKFMFNLIFGIMLQIQINLFRSSHDVPKNVKAFSRSLSWDSSIAFPFENTICVLRTLYGASSVIQILVMPE